MKALFDQLTREGEPAVRRLLRRSEQLDFDCKLKKDSSNGKVDREDKETLGPLLSAFANSMGGLALWGVNARKDAEKADVIIGFCPIANIARFESEMRDLVVEALMPRHEGITLSSIASTDTPGAGYLAINVDRSERRPHESQFGARDIIGERERRRGAWSISRSRTPSGAWLSPRSNSIVH